VIIVGKKRKGGLFRKHCTCGRKKGRLKDKCKFHDGSVSYGDIKD